MSGSHRPATRAMRDQDLAGVEAALLRAARRARRRAQEAARAAGSKGATFSRAQGYEEIPGLLCLEQLPREARTRIWNLFFSHLDATKATDNMGYGPWVGEEWASILVDVHAQLDNLPLDEWRADFEPIRKRLRERIESEPFNRVFDFIQFVLQHRRCDPRFRARMKSAFVACRLAYAIDIGPPPTIVPAVTLEEGEVLVDSLRALRQAGLDGSAAHLRESATLINAGDWAGSVRESIHAVESVARQLDPRASATLGPALDSLRRRGTLHPSLEVAFQKLYGYTNADPGIRHALLDQHKASAGRDEAVFMLGACASFASYLWRRHVAG